MLVTLGMSTVSARVVRTGLRKAIQGGGEMVGYPQKVELLTGKEGDCKPKARLTVVSENGEKQVSHCLPDALERAA